MSPKRSILCLPSHIIQDILSRLPIKTVIHSRCICKKWLSLLLDPHFAKLHFSRSATSLVIHDLGSNPHIFRLVEVEDEPDHHEVYEDLLIKFDIRSKMANSLLLLVGSINGFLCMWNLDDGFNDSVCICNPITREYIMLPMPRYTRQGYSYISYGFGFTLKTGHYKVLRLIQGLASDSATGLISNISKAEVYTLGSGKWRSLGHIAFAVPARLNGVFFNGNLHFLTYDTGNSQSIRCFDVDQELFRKFPFPPKFGMESLVVLGGFLSLCDMSSDTELVIWVMKEYGVKESWTKEIIVSINLDPFAFSLLHPLKVFKDGKILVFLKNDNTLLTLDPENKSWESLQICKNSDEDVIFHVPSFISLGDIVKQTEKVDKF